MHKSPPRRMQMARILRGDLSFNIVIYRRDLYKRRSDKRIRATPSMIIFRGDYWFSFCCCWMTNSIRRSEIWPGRKKVISQGILVDRRGPTKDFRFDLHNNVARESPLTGIHPFRRARHHRSLGRVVAICRQLHPRYLSPRTCFLRGLSSPWSIPIAVSLRRRSIYRILG